jgi:hypothetical protein
MLDALCKVLRCREYFVLSLFDKSEIGGVVSAIKQADSYIFL